MSEPQRQPDIEQDILAFWARERIFERSVERDPPRGEFVFYEGPPTANAPPGIHHVIGRTFKDVIPRYQTMRGRRVRRKAGWDTHGLPVELQIEKKLGLKTKKEIEAYGIAAFNAACRDSVWEFKQEWERLTERIGFWLDQRDPYVTYESSYIESVWWFLKQAWERELLVRDYKVVPWCPRCETPLSSHEVALGYEDDVEDPSVMVRLVLTAESTARLHVPDGTAFLVWTTTPWTLPGNGALAVHPKGEYAIVRQGDACLILARPLVGRVFGEGAVIERTVSGKDLVALRYEPLYPRIDTVAYREAYQVLEADFVSFDDGTGIVHIAPAYGEDDFRFKSRGIPPTFSVNEKGIMADGLPGAGKFCKDADTDIRADLRSRGLLFRDETIRHTYPFCWRCKTPLLYYARASWYIAMARMREEIQERNKTIQWHPEHLRDGRFGEWLRGLKDWAITRERSWGTPLPIWQCDRCQTREVVGSFEELIAKAPKRNRFILMRHGEARSNVDGTMSTNVATSDQYPLTVDGRARVTEAAIHLRDVGITTIIASPFARMRETAEIVSQAIGVPVTYDDRLREIDLPDFDGKPVEEYRAQFSADRAQRRMEKFTKKIGENETWDELARRVLLALRDIDRANEHQSILICSHGDPLFLLQWAFSGRTRVGITDIPYPAFDAPTEFAFTSALVDDRGELDVHRPYVDAITWPCAQEGCGGSMERFPEVVDVWMDSGCMPFAQHHYPFELPPEGLYRSASAASDEASGGKGSARPRARSEPATLAEGKGPRENREVVPRSADYISEAIDQTRGWFYTLLAVATVLGWEAPYRNVICYSHILDREGKKMSKSKGNVVDPWAMIDRYGADVVRWYMLTVNQPWDPKRFDEADLKAMANKPFGTLRNLLAFWELHGGSAATAWSDAHVLDAWLRARFVSLHHDVTAHLDAYEITEAARAIGEAIDDLSTWWLRRSRERLKTGDADARATFSVALRSLAVLLAPFAPFTAEHVWQTLRKRGQTLYATGSDPSSADSVHLAMWDDGAPSTGGADAQLLEDMAKARHLASLGLEARASANIPVRQPLQSFFFPKQLAPVMTNLFAIIAAEINVGEVIPDPALTESGRLNTELTPALKREGIIRELTRAVNNLRKRMGLTPGDRIRVVYATDHAEFQQAIAEHHDVLLRGTHADAWEIGTPSSPHELDIGGGRIALAITRT